MERGISFTLVLLFISSLMAAKIEHPIYNRMLELQPKMNRIVAMKISNSIHACHKRIGVDKYLLVAILNQESKISNNNNNCSSAVLDNRSIDLIFNMILKYALILNIEKMRKDLSVIMIGACFDFGIGQINIKTTKRFKNCSNVSRLQTDLRYNINCSCSVLEDIKERYEHKEEYWWLRYNSNNRIKQRIYKELVERYLVGE